MSLVWNRLQKLLDGLQIGHGWITDVSQMNHIMGPMVDYRVSYMNHIRVIYCYLYLGFRRVTEESWDRL